MAAPRGRSGRAAAAVLRRRVEAALCSIPGSRHRPVLGGPQRCRLPRRSSGELERRPGAVGPRLPRHRSRAHRRQPSAPRVVDTQRLCLGGVELQQERLRRGPGSEGHPRPHQVLQRLGRRAGSRLPGGGFHGRPHHRRRRRAVPQHLRRRHAHLRGDGGFRALRLLPRLQRRRPAVGDRVLAIPGGPRGLHRDHRAPDQGQPRRSARRVAAIPQPPGSATEGPDRAQVRRRPSQLRRGLVLLEHLPRFRLGAGELPLRSGDRQRDPGQVAGLGGGQRRRGLSVRHRSGALSGGDGLQRRHRAGDRRPPSPAPGRARSGSPDHREDHHSRVDPAQPRGPLRASAQRGGLRAAGGSAGQE